MMEKPLLILDLDETLIHGLKEPLEIDFDMLLGPYFIYFRPFAVDFLRSQSDRYQLGFWSSATISYVGPICRQLMKGNPDPLFVWDRERCTERFDHFQQETYYAKDLSKVERKRLNLARVLIVDDELRKVKGHYGNALLVKAFRGEEADDELVFLDQYLLGILPEPDFRKLDKSNWRSSLSVMPPS